MRARETDALAFTRTFAIDPAFGPFVNAARARGDEVMVVSEGFSFYVRDQLARAGLADLPWAANDLAFVDDARVEPSFPFADPACDSCGNCKAQHVRRYRERGFHTVLVGDGVSDRHGALAADTVLARGSLLEWCRSEGVPHTPAHDFTEVDAWAAHGRSARPTRARWSRT